MPINPNSVFDAPVPGQSLTLEKGSTRFEHPPQYTNIDDALEFLLEKMSSKKQVVRLVLMLKDGNTVEFIARSILFQGFTTGKWTPDMALLMLRIVMAMIIAIASNAGVKNPKILNVDKSQNDFLDQFVGKGDTNSADTTEEAPINTPSLPKLNGILGGLQ